MAGRAADYVRARIDAWRTGSVRAQWTVAGVLLLLVAGSFVVSMVNRGLMPLTAYFLWLLLSRILLSFWPLLVVAVVDALAGSLSLLLPEDMSAIRWVAILEFLLAVALVLYVARRARSSLPGPLSEVLLVDLKDRLQAQGRIPPLPEGWESQSAMLASHGASYAGDFLVAELSGSGRRLEVILVDVCGKGTAAGPAALQFAGALGGLIGAMPPDELMRAANTFLLRQGDEAFATAVHVLIDLEDGSYRISSAGHPPALRWDLPSGEWLIDNARGTALGVLPDPELHQSQGRLLPGEALLFYTDGVVEARGSHLDAGIAWLQRAAREAVGSGFRGAAHRIIGQVQSGDDDRAVLILSRVR
jgi:Stage II sporulation protein E (SpoIIE)